MQHNEVVWKKDKKNGSHEGEEWEERQKHKT